MYPQIIQKLILEISKFPTIGPKSAARIVFYLTKLNDKEVSNLINLIKSLKDTIKICKRCFKTFESKVEKYELCEICLSPKRDKNTICVVEKEQDLEAIEQTGEYNGNYFILGETINLMDPSKKMKRENNLISLIKREKDIKEIILALNPTIEGEATSSYLFDKLKQFNIKITKLAKGMPYGGELEYADRNTISESLKKRDENI